MTSSAWAVRPLIVAAILVWTGFGLAARQSRPSAGVGVFK